MEEVRKTKKNTPKPYFDIIKSLTKFDILGVNVLSTIDRVCKSIGEKVEDFPIDDQKTFEVFNSGNTLGVFQFETHSFSKLIKELHPDNFEELVDLNTLGRPGALESTMYEDYSSRKHDNGSHKMSVCNGKFYL